MLCSTTPCVFEGFFEKNYEDVMHDLHFGIQEELLLIMWKLSKGTDISLVVKNLTQVIEKLQWIRSMNEIFLNSTRGQTLKVFNELMLYRAKKYIDIYVNYFM